MKSLAQGHTASRSRKLGPRSGPAMLQGTCASAPTCKALSGLSFTSLLLQVPGSRDAVEGTRGCCSPLSLSPLSALPPVAPKVRPWKKAPFLPSLDLEGQLLIGCRIERLGYAQGPPPLESQTRYLLCQSLALDSVLVRPGFHTWRRRYTIFIDSQVSDYSVWRCGA